MSWYHIHHVVGDSDAPKHVIIETDTLDSACHIFEHRYGDDPAGAEHFWSAAESEHKYSINDHDTYRDALRHAFGEHRSKAVGKMRLTLNPSDIDQHELAVIADEM